MRTRRVAGLALALLLGGAIAGCSDVQGPVAPATTVRAGMVAAAPTPILPVTYGESTLHLWPYTGDNFAGTTVDPINLLFPGATVQQVRAALLGLGGTRAGYPPMAPFDCVWQDGGETVQVGYAEDKWVGSPVQLTCGDYSFRYHVRLFQAGGWVYGGAHFEIQVPGTNSHNVLSWAAARDLVMGDLYAAGFVDYAPTLVDLGTGARYRVIDYPMVYYGLLQQAPALAGYLNVEPITLALDNGPAALIHLANAPAVERTVERQEWTLDFNQIIPKPFCGTGYVHAEGPIEMVRQLVVTGSGNYVTHFQGKGTLTLTPWNPTPTVEHPMGVPTGEPTYTAIASEKDRGLVTDGHMMVANAQMQIMLPNAPERGSMTLSFMVGPQGATNFDFAVNCTK